MQFTIITIFSMQQEAGSFECQPPVIERYFFYSLKLSFLCNVIHAAAR